MVETLVATINRSFGTKVTLVDTIYRSIRTTVKLFCIGDRNDRMLTYPHHVQPIEDIPGQHKPVNLEKNFGHHIT